MTYKYKCLPCPVYDAERIESWLTDMAKAGLVLTDDGFTAGIAKFETGEPKNIRYRLEAAAKRPGILSENGGPDEEETELYKEFGWNYKGYIGGYYVYCADENIRELNTDTEVQAISVNVLHRRIRNAFIAELIEAAIIVFCNLRFGLVLAISEAGTVYLALLAVLFIWLLVSKLREIKYCSALVKKLKNHEEPGHNKNWKNGAALHRVSVILFTLLLTVCAVWFIVLFINSHKEKENISAYIDTLPYITMKSMAKDGSYVQDDAFYASNEYESRRDILVLQTINSSEHAEFETEDGIQICGGMYVDYYEVKYEFMAKLLMRELHREKHTTKAYKTMKAPDIDADDVFAFHDIFDTVVIRHGSKVIKVMFYQSGEDAVSFSTWAKTAADSIR